MVLPLRPGWSLRSQRALLQSRNFLIGLSFHLKKSDSDDHAREGVGKIADFIVGEAAYGDLQISHAYVFRYFLEVVHWQQDGSAQHDTHDKSNDQAQE
jgi:hypothetical protein